MRGFTMLEMLIALSMFILLSSMFLVNYNTFNKRVSLDTLAHQIGQWVRDAQISAMSVKNSRSAGAFPPGYGLHFDRATSDRFIFFADLDNDNQYDSLTGIQKCGDSGVECERVVNLLQGNTISTLCGDSPGTATSLQCATAGAVDTSNVFDITFTRPNPDAVIVGDLNGASFPTEYSRARIGVVSVKGYERTIEVWTTGQISIQ